MAEDSFAPAAREALKAFPIEPDALELVSLAENVTYRLVDRSDGVAYALRLHRPWYHTLDELISERAWIRALADVTVETYGYRASSTMLAICLSKAERAGGRRAVQAEDHRRRGGGADDGLLQQLGYGEEDIRKMVSLNAMRLAGLGANEAPALAKSA